MSYTWMPPLAHLFTQRAFYVMAALLSNKSSLKPEPLGEVWVVPSCASGLALKHGLQM